MRGLILAGGHGTRLHPTSKVVNKHLFPIFDKPLIFYAIETLRDAGVKDIVLSLGDHDSERFFDLLRGGEELGVNLQYDYHGEPKGIAYAINHVQYEFPEFLDEPFVVLLGDNIFCDGLKMAVKCFRETQAPLAVIKRMPWKKACNYGVVFFDGPQNEYIADIVEKPKIDRGLIPATAWAVLGAYFLDGKFFEAYKGMKPSARGEYEITDALKRIDGLAWIAYGGHWWDCGTPFDILNASMWRYNQVRKKGEPEVLLRHNSAGVDLSV